MSDRVPGEPCWTHKDVKILARHCVHPVTVFADTWRRMEEIANWIEASENGTRGRFLFVDMPGRTNSTGLVGALEPMVRKTAQHAMLFECPNTAFLVRMKFG